MPLFGRSFSMFSPGNRRGSMVPQPIILGTAGLRLGTVTFNGTEINAGAAKAIPEFPAIAGMFWLPVAFASYKNILVIHAPTNAGFTVRYDGLATNLSSSITPQVVSLGERIDHGTDIGASITSPNDARNRALVVAPSAANGGGTANNFIRFTIAAILCRAV